MKSRKIVMAGVLALALVVASGAIAFASTDSTKTAAKPDTMTQAQREAVRTAETDSMKTATAIMVKDGTLTSAESEAILAKLAAKAVTPEKTTKGGIVERKNDGHFSTLTKDQISALMKERSSLQQTALDALVTAGTITSDQEKAILARSPGVENKLDLTDAQKTAVREASENSMKQAVSNMEAAGTITEAEAASILAVPSERKTDAAAVKPKMEEKNGIYSGLTDDQVTALKAEYLLDLKAKLTALTDSGTITEDIAAMTLERASEKGTQCHDHQGMEHN
jgi:hypothetical protein